jgi:hypothetical protein
MKYTTEEVLDILFEDELNHPSGKPADEIADLHSVLADMVVEGKIKLIMVDNRPVFKAPEALILIDNLTFTPEMLN